MIVVGASQPCQSRTRAGITLTEILIAILIMGVGLISLATLFPIGLLRLRDATRYSRTAFLTESAASEIAARGLLVTQSFIAADLLNFQYFGNFLWYPSGLSGTGFYDPLVQDTPAYGLDGYTSFMNAPGPGVGDPAVAALGLTPQQYPRLNAGLPFAYDPLWRYQVLNPNTGVSGYYLDPLNQTTLEARFGSGIGFIRSDPSDQGLPSAHGLQRLTNFNGSYATVNKQLIPVMPTYLSVPNIFVSPEDLVWQESTNNHYTVAFNPTISVGIPSTVVPDLSMTRDANGNPTYQTTADWRYTWMFTGYQTNAGNASTYEGNIVIFENRPFAIDPVTNPPFATGPTAKAYQVAGETVVEAVFGWSTNVSVDGADGFTVGYGAGSDRTVLLRWPNTLPDPVVKAGDWIADVTYERQASVVFNPQAGTGRFYNMVGNPPVIWGTPNLFNFKEWDNVPAQRCIWYQVQKVVAAADVIKGSPLDFDKGANGPYRYMFVYVNSSLQARTVLTTAGVPVVLNAALIAPNVINVIPQTIFQ
jgi:hypothetical protein